MSILNFPCRKTRADDILRRKSALDRFKERHIFQATLDDIGQIEDPIERRNLAALLATYAYDQGWNDK